MPITKTALLGLTVCALATTAFAAPKPDVTPAPAKPQAVKVMLKSAPKKTMVLVKRRRADVSRPVGVKAVVIDEPNLQTGTVSVVTEKNEFATISTGMGTRIGRGESLAALGNIHVGYTLRCYGAWDQDGFQYQATRITLGDSVSDTTLIGRVNAACENIAKARKGGGFGQATVAIASQTGIPKAIGIETGTTPPAEPIPADLVPGQTPPAKPAPLAPATPVDPTTVPAVPTVPPAAPQGTNVPTP